jgi:membrane protein DedA with SNARE-associated domain
MYAYMPWMVYGGICVFMVLSAFGLPLPEEAVLVSASVLGYHARHPLLYPPPYPDALGINPYVLAVVALVAVIGSDYLIYYLGHRFGPKLLETRWFARLISESAMARIQRWMQAYGYWAVIIFRFTPGVRFPGHLMCGITGVSKWKFLTVDSVAAVLSVPTQVLLVCFYGQYIMHYFSRFKTGLLIAVVVGFVIFMTIKVMDSRKNDDPKPIN